MDELTSGGKRRRASSLARAGYKTMVPNGKITRMSDCVSEYLGKHFAP